MSTNVNSLHTVKFVGENVRDSAHSPLRSRHISVQISRHCDLSFPVVSAEFQTQHCAVFQVRFKCMTLCRQVCFVRIRVDIGKCRLLLLYDVLHEHVLQHYMFHRSQTSFGCPCLRRLAVDMVHECHFVSLFFQEMFCLLPFGNSSCQGVLICFGRTQAHCCFLDQAERVVLPRCVTSPLVLLHVWCRPAQSLSVYTFTNGMNLLISIKHFAIGISRCASRSSRR